MSSRFSAAKSARLTGTASAPSGDLAAKIEGDRRRMAEMQAVAKPDFDAIDKQEEQLDWDTRIFQDRQQALSYVCETPVILEQRVFALARAIAAGLK